MLYNVIQLLDLRNVIGWYTDYGLERKRETVAGIFFKDYVVLI